jgi:hypothetical protein
VSIEKNKRKSIRETFGSDESGVVPGKGTTKINKGYFESHSRSSSKQEVGKIKKNEK